MKPITTVGTLAVAAALAVGGAATAAATSTSGATLLDGGKVKLAKPMLPVGAATFVATNRGRQTHAFAIKGPGIAGKRTATIAPGKSARLTVRLKKGMYMVWDPLRGSMNRSSMLMVG